MLTKVHNYYFVSSYDAESLFLDIAKVEQIRLIRRLWLRTTKYIVTYMCIFQEKSQNQLFSQTFKTIINLKLNFIFYFSDISILTDVIAKNPFWSWSQQRPLRVSFLTKKLVTEFFVLQVRISINTRHLEDIRESETNLMMYYKKNPFEYLILNI